ncbi:MAG: enoyl-CoA hydratase-related protein [Acetobacteraceae bacterium]
MPAARLGLHYYAGGLQRYVTRLGLGAAKWLFLTAEPLDAAGLLRIGYLDELVPPERLDARVAELAAILAANAPLPVQGMKAALNAIARGEVDLDAINAGQATCQHSVRRPGGGARGLAGKAHAAVYRGLTVRVFREGGAVPDTRARRGLLLPPAEGSICVGCDPACPDLTQALTPIGGHCTAWMAGSSSAKTAGQGGDGRSDTRRGTETAPGLSCRRQCAVPRYASRISGFASSSAPGPSILIAPFTST